MLNVVLSKPNEVVYEGQARSVILPGENGVLELLPFHKPLMSRLIAGSVIIDGKAFSIRRGVVGVSLDKVTVIIEE